MRLTWVFVTIGLCAACNKEPVGVTKTTASPVKVEPVAKQDPVATTPQRKLALQRLTGAGAADRAVDAAQGAVRKNAGSFDLWVTLGQTWVKKARESNDPGFYLNASACADVVLAEQPESKLAMNLKALVLLNDHKFEDARALSRKIVERNPDDAMAFGSLSDAELEIGLYEDAGKSAQTMMDLKPNLPSYSRASHLAWLHGDVKGATETIKYDDIEINGVDYYYMIRKLDAVTKDVAQKEGAIYIDAAGETETSWEEGDFYDYTHMTPQGARKLGLYLHNRLKDRF